MVKTCTTIYPPWLCSSQTEGCLNEHMTYIKTRRRENPPVCIFKRGTCGDRAHSDFCLLLVVNHRNFSLGWLQAVGLHVMSFNQWSDTLLCWELGIEMLKKKKKKARKWRSGCLATSCFFCFTDQNSCWVYGFSFIKSAKSDRVAWVCFFILRGIKIDTEGPGLWSWLHPHCRMTLHLLYITWMTTAFP